MENVNSYIEILIDSLKKKSEILDCISAENARQLSAIKDDPIDYELFEATIEKKETYIEQLNVMDGAFQKVFDRVKDALEKDKSQYTSQIKIMKALVQEVTDKAMNIQAEETRNKETFTNAALNMRQKVKSVKAAKKVASGYYDNMNKLNVVEPQFMDKKK